MAYTIDWNTAGANSAFTLVDGTDTVDVTVTTVAASNGDTATTGNFGLPSAPALYVSSIREPVSSTIEFSDPVENISFEIFDIDFASRIWDESLTIIALDANGNQVPISYSDLDGLHSINGDTIDGDGNFSPFIETLGAEDSVTVNIVGPVSSIEFIFDNGESYVQSADFGISNITFSEAGPDYVVEGGSGDDIIDAAFVGDPEGDQIENNDALDGSQDDTVYAGSGNDTITSQSGSDTIYGDSIFIDPADYPSGNEGSSTSFTFVNASPIDVQLYWIDTTGTPQPYDVVPADGSVLRTTLSDHNWLVADPDTGEFYELIGNPADGSTYTFDSQGNDTINAGAQDDVVYGEYGDDVINAGDGADTAYGGQGNDTIDGGVGNDTIYGGSGNDTISDTGGGFDYIDAGSGDDVVSAGGNDDVVFLGSGSDTFGDSFIDFGNDTIYGDRLDIDPADFPTATTGAATSFTFVNDSPDAVELYYVDENGVPTGIDVVQPGASTVVNSFEGHQWLVGEPATTDTFYMVLGSPEDGSTHVYTNTADDTINGRGGADTIYGDMGDDQIIGGTGNDTLYGGSGSDNFQISGDEDTDVIFGGEDSDLGDIDSITYSESGESTDGVTVTMTGFEAGSYDFGGFFGSGTFSEIEMLVGTRYDDSFNGAAATNDWIIDAGDGADAITTGVGADSIDAGSGADTIDGGAGDDTIDLGANTAGTATDGDADVVVFSDGDGNDTISNIDQPTANGDGTFTGIDTLDVSNLTSDGGTTPVTVGDVVVTDDGSGNALLTFPGGETLTLVGMDPTFTSNPQVLIALGIPGDGIVSGTAGDDIIQAGTYFGDPDGDLVDNNDALLPGEIGDDDIIQAGAGNDIVNAGAGSDEVDGGTGNDIIDGGAGADTMYGGDDADTFVGGTAGDVVIGGEGGSDNDTLDLTGSGPTNVIYDESDPEAGTVEFLDGSGNVTGTMTFSEIETVNFVPCFTTGTKIRTIRGEVNVERLRIGDKVLTRDHGFEPVRWVGMRALSAANLAAAPELAPITIKAGALGECQPAVDTRVSPQHRMLAVGANVQLMFGEDEVLVPAKHMLGRDGFTQDANDGVTYVHIMFDQHEVVSGDGAWSESFQPGDQSLGTLVDEQREELFSIFPELRDDSAQIDYVAARVSLKAHEAALLF